MKTESGIAGQVPDEIRVLTFRISDICFGMDMEQIAGMRSPEQINSRDYRIRRFEEILPFRRHESRTCGSDAPMIVLLNDAEKVSGIYIEHPEDINVSVPISTVRPMPELIEICDRSSPIWGVALRQGRMILLTDFYKLMARQRQGDF